jgi:hypothetical protein
MKTINLLAVAAALLLGCGDNKTAPDARVRDGMMTDTPIVFPAAPTVGAQIDRMGRAAVNTALNHGFDSTAATVTDKKAYNEESSKTAWLAPARIGEFMSNLAIIDVLDTGVCGNGICETGEANVAGGGNLACTADCPTAAQVGVGNGCGNQVLYTPAGGGGPAATSYQSLAGLLAEDELYLDTSKATCAFYLAVEFGVATGGGNTTCGGRAPQYDVIDFSFSMLAMGLKGFNTSFVPQVQDGVAAHTDVSPTAFPFLGAPH